MFSEETLLSDDTGDEAEMEESDIETCDENNRVNSSTKSQIEILWRYLKQKTIKFNNATKRKCSATDKQPKRKKSNESATDSDV